MTTQSGAAGSAPKRVLLLLLTVLALACTSQPPPTAAPGPTSSPGPTPAGSTSAVSTPAGSPVAPPTPTAAPTPPPKNVGDLALEMCDPEDLLPCEHQAALAYVPVMGSGVSLTYSSEWADGRLDRPQWSAAPLGLGGWSLDVLPRYDPASGVLQEGDGSWRLVAPTRIGEGEQAVPTYDALRYYVFDDAWHLVRTVDDVTGATLLTFTYDSNGLLAGVSGHLDTRAVHLDIERGDDGNARSLLGFAETRTNLLISADGNLVSILHPGGYASDMKYDPFGLLSSWREPGRGPTTFTYDSAGRLASATDADAVALNYAFEGVAGAATVTTTNGAGATRTVKSERTGDAMKRTFTDFDGTVTTLDLATNGTTALTDPDGTITTIGILARPSWGLSAPVLTPYDQRTADGATYHVETASVMGVGTGGQPGGASWGTDYDVNGQHYGESYDASARTLTRVDPAGRVSVDSFDANGYLVSRAAPGAPSKAFAYDSLGRITSLTVGHGSSIATTTYTYNDTTGEVTVTNPDGTTSRSTFDALGNVALSSSDGESAAFQRDLSGNLMQVRLGSHPASSLGYSAAGRTTAYIPPVLADDMTYEQTTYNADGLPVVVSGPGDRAIRTNYDTAGRATGWEFDAGSVALRLRPAERPARSQHDVGRRDDDVRLLRRFAGQPRVLRTRGWLRDPGLERPAPGCQRGRQRH